MKHRPHVYLPAPWGGDGIAPTPNQVRHLGTVLKIGAGSPVTYTDGRGNLGHGVWRGNRVVRGSETQVARPSELTMAVAPPSNKDRVRFLVEKLAELGVRSLVWLGTEWGTRRTPSKEKAFSWSVAGLEQSRGAWLMETDPELKSWASLRMPLVVCKAGGGDIEFRPQTVVVGPEGGFAAEEIPAEAALVGLGKTILRVETAAIVAAARFL